MSAPPAAKPVSFDQLADFLQGVHGTLGSHPAAEPHARCLGAGVISDRDYMLRSARQLDERRDRAAARGVEGGVDSPRAQDRGTARRRRGSSDKRARCACGRTTRPHAPGRLAAAALDALGTVDILVNDAAIAARVETTELSAELIDAMYAVNLRASLLLIGAVIPAMQPAGGSIVNFSPVSGVIGTPRRLACGATRFSRLISPSRPTRL